MVDEISIMDVDVANNFIERLKASANSAKAMGETIHYISSMEFMKNMIEYSSTRASISFERKAGKVSLDVSCPVICVLFSLGGFW